MKKLLIVLLTVVLIVGCGSKEESITEDTIETNNTQEIIESEIVETIEEVIEEVVEEPTQNLEEKEEASINGIDPDFKEAVDSYEKFMNEYVDFINEFNAATDNTSMMAKYLEYMGQYADTMSKLDGLEQEDLSTEEVIYYNEAMTRILKKLNEIQ